MMLLREFFCWHDWRIHEKGPDTWLAKAIRGDVDASICISLFVAIIMGLSINWSLTTFIGAPWSMVVGVVMAMIGFTLSLIQCYQIDVLDNDPGRSDDRTCLKCGKVEFNASWRKKRDAKRMERQDRRTAKSERRQAAKDALLKKKECLREEKIAKIDAQFKGFKAFWEKANA